MKEGTIPSPSEPAAHNSDLTIVPYEDDDEDSVIALLRTSLKGGTEDKWTHDFFRWKHLKNPFGRSYMTIARSGDHVVGFRAFLRWSFVAGGRRFRAVRAVDTATHPDHQRRGIFRSLTLRALSDLRGEIDFVFNTPNTNSAPGYLKMGWVEVGRLRFGVQTRHPMRVAHHFLKRNSSQNHEKEQPVDARVLDESHTQAERLRNLMEVRSDTACLTTERSLAFIDWRYRQIPWTDYHTVSCERNGVVEGMAIFRMRERFGLRETRICEFFSENDSDVTTWLLREVGKVSKADHVIVHHPSCKEPKMFHPRRKLIPVPKGILLTAHPLGEDLVPDPSALDSWNLSLGDIELF